LNNTNDPRTTGSRYQETTADKARDYADQAIHQGTEYAERAQDVAAEKLGELEASIRRHPLQAAAIAAGVGFVLALLARR